jgi:hypothetical protein
MGIPALVCTGEISQMFDGTVALLDASNGSLTLSPSEEETAIFATRCAKNAEMETERARNLHTLLDKPAVTQSGHRILIYANVGGEEEIDAALCAGRKWGKNTIAKMPSPKPLTLCTKPAPMPIKIKNTPCTQSTQSPHFRLYHKKAPRGNTQKNRILQVQHSESRHCHIWKHLQLDN